ncbi:hypothetical protein [Anabaenopsis elenkinii]|uniref:Uncharacterized protein n=1 Tax=Anabaenopsis elenkinii CCIBt3563 TaxID=2779889 RepID=A0A7S6RCW9_9CYAN|nr:hypothetical protein [Anabaenopsis elenkinii]QOV22623.1 hypothetical protein IM676_18550 [Anabaenopsis elenkinii CCIBt3563]
MKRFNFFVATSMWGCFLTFLCADFVLAGPVPVGSLSGVTLPGRLTAPVTVTPNVTASPVTVTPNVTASPVTVTPNVTASPVTVTELGQTTAAQVAIGRGVTVTGRSRTLSIPATTATVNNQVSTMVTLVSVNDQPSQFFLEGTSRQVTNASAFLAVATAAEFNQSQVQIGTSIALTGAEYTQVAALMDTLPALFVSLSNQKSLHKLTAVVESPGKQVNFSQGLIMSREDNKFQGVPISNVDRQKLNTAIIIYNAILESSDEVTVIALSQNEDFLAIGSGLRQMRAAINSL